MSETAWFAVAALLGFAIGFMVAMELGRIVYNRKMDEIRAKVLDVKRLL